MNKPIIHTAVLAVALTASLPISAAHAQIHESLWGLSMIGVDKAWEQGFRGNGIVVGVMDDATQVDHPQFADRWLGEFNADGTPYGPLGAHYHGTHVTGTVAGRSVGVAPGSLIYGINWLVAAPTDASFAQGYRWATSQGVRVVNNSWGALKPDPVTGKNVSMTIVDLTRAEFELGSPAVLQALRESVSADVVQVFSTGNDAFTQPGVMAGLPHFFPELQPNWIAVTAVGPTGSRASYAQHCGLAAAWCIAAPGGESTLNPDDGIWSSMPGSIYGTSIGTSMAAPHVTGAVAIAAEIFSKASGAQLTQLVLQTATDIGEKGIDATYGWGLLNIGNMVATINPETAGTFANAGWSRTTAFAPINTVLRQQLGRIASPPSGAEDFSALGYAPTNLVSMPESVRLSQPSGPQVWVAPVYGTASIAAGPTSYGADSNTGGLLAGIDILHDANAQFGLALGYSHTALKTQTAGDSADTNAFHLGAYGAWQQDGWFINGTGQAALFSQSIERKAISGALGLSFDPVGRTTLSGSGLGVSLQAGHEIVLSNGASVSPYLAAAATWQGTGAAQESGAGIFNLTLPAANHAQFEAGPGVRFASAPILLEDNTLRLTLDLSYARVGGNVDNGTTVDLLGREITGRSTELGRDVLRVGGTIDLTTGAGHDWFAAYDGSFRQGAAAHSISAGFKVSL